MLFKNNYSLVKKKMSKKKKNPQSAHLLIQLSLKKKKKKGDRGEKAFDHLHGVWMKSFVFGFNLLILYLGH